MTVKKKKAQMTQIERTVASPRTLAVLDAGSVLNAGGSVPRRCASPTDWATMVDGMQSPAPLFSQ
jgi:beta-glucosidase